MVLKAKKMVKDVKTYKIGDADTRKGPSRRSSKSTPTRRLKAEDEQLFRQSQTKRIKSPPEIMQSLSNYYKDLLK